MTEKANRPTGRSTRATSATATSMSLTNCRAPKEQKTTSKLASANGTDELDGVPRMYVNGHVVPTWIDPAEVRRRLRAAIAEVTPSA